MPRLDLSAGFPTALRRLFRDVPSRRAPGRGSSPVRPSGPPWRVRPLLEALEDRVTPTTFTPTTFADDGTAGSLRGALAQAEVQFSGIRVEAQSIAVGPCGFLEHALFGQSAGAAGIGVGEAIGPLRPRVLAG